MTHPTDPTLPLVERLNEAAANEMAGDLRQLWLEAATTLAEGAERERALEAEIKRLVEGGFSHQDGSRWVREDSRQEARDRALAAEARAEAAEASERGLREALERTRRCLGFFASVIKSGEAWSGTCESEYRAALSPQPDPAT